MRSELARGSVSLSRVPGLEGLEFVIASAEDILLAKLGWYRRWGETSERQWHDILGILRVQRNRLDNRYLTEWAANLGG